MLLEIPELLSLEQVRHCRDRLAEAEWIDGRVTAGHQSAQAKDNEQVDERSPIAIELGEMILKALQKDLMFVSAALPQKIYPPLFNRYTGGQHFGTHIDGAIRPVTGTPHRVRTDLSATLFLTDPADYDGGELSIQHRFGAESIKLPAGHLLLYPATSLHRVLPVTRGARIASFFWIQSMVRDEGERSLLFDLDVAIQKISRELPQHPALIEMTGVYNNLLRRWSQV